MKHDSVCGMAAEESTAAGHVSYQGQTYFFWSSNCLNKFSASPSSFVSATRSSAPARTHHAVGDSPVVTTHAVPGSPPSGAVEYTRPMRPEIGS